MPVLWNPVNVGSLLALLCTLPGTTDLRYHHILPQGVSFCKLKDSSQFRFVPLGGLPFQIKILVASILFLTLLSESLLKFSTLSTFTKMVTLTYIFCLNFTGKNQTSPWFVEALALRLLCLKIIFWNFSVGIHHHFYKAETRHPHDKQDFSPSAMIFITTDEGAHSQYQHESNTQY